MKITANRATLLGCLEKVIGVAQGASINPILSNVLLRVDKTSLHMTATDQETQLMSSCVIAADKKFAMAVSAKKLQGILQKLDADAEMKIEFVAEKSEEAQTVMHLSAGRSRYKLLATVGDRFPQLGDKDMKPMLTSPANDFLHSIKRVSYASAHQSHRLNLNGVFLEGSADGFRLVATDGHRMAMQSLALQKSEEEIQMILPRKSVDELIRNLPAEGEREIKVEANERAARFVTDGFILTSNLIDENFPDYRSVIPHNNSKVATIERKPFLSALQRVVVVSEQKGASVILSFSEKNPLRLECKNPENESADDELEISYQGEDIKIGFNGDFLLDMLSRVENDVFEIRLLDDSTSVLIEAAGDKEKDFRYIIMPVRI